MANFHCPDCNAYTRSDQCRRTTTGQRRIRCCERCRLRFTTFQPEGGDEVFKVRLEVRAYDYTSMEYDPLCCECLLPECIRPHDFLRRNDGFWTRFGCLLAAARHNNLEPGLALSQLRVRRYETIALEVVQ